MKLTKKEKDILNILVGITTSIKESLDELQILENNNLQETPNWKASLSKLKSSLSLEVSIYDKVALEEASNIFHYLEYNDNIASELKIIMNLQVEELCKKRIGIKLLGLINQNDKQNNRIENLIGQTYLEIVNWIKEDFINTILTLLNKYIREIEDDKVKDYFLKIKYALSFIYPFIEEDLLNHNMNINPDLYWKSVGLASASGLTALQENFATNIADQIPIVIFEKQNMDFSWEIIYFYQLLMRVYFIFNMNDSHKEGIIDSFRKAEDVKVTEDNVIWKKFLTVINSLEYIADDKELVRIIKIAK